MLPRFGGASDRGKVFAFKSLWWISFPSVVQQFEMGKLDLLKKKNVNMSAKKSTMELKYFKVKNFDNSFWNSFILIFLPHVVI